MTNPTPLLAAARKLRTTIDANAAKSKDESVPMETIDALVQAGLFGAMAPREATQLVEIESGEPSGEEVAHVVDRVAEGPVGGAGEAQLRVEGGDHRVDTEQGEQSEERGGETRHALPEEVPELVEKALGHR